jgi:PAB-dependent poly(A)-specific ribonuclease subunit 3
LDVLQYDGILNVARQQQEDLLLFGKLIIGLTCYQTSYTDLQQSLDHISKHYSADMKNFIFYLLSQPVPTKSIDEIIVMIAPRILSEINSNQL